MKKFNNQKNEMPFISAAEKVKLLEKIEVALLQIQDGAFLTEEELDKEIETWINSPD
ncbi:MAG: hypothetical protein JWR09_4394 [Mucilaginibacter sp.]|nr:hypothetical protein [Mucilaginibacter sp.]